MPLISVIIPTHNGTTRFLDQALDSVFGQTYSRLGVDHRR